MLVLTFILTNFFIFTFQLSILVHPDKNQDDPERAQKAFEGRNTCFNVYLCMLVTPKYCIM